MTNKFPNPQEFINSYGPDAPVVVGKGMEMTLGQALEAERLLCPADIIAKQDSAKRIGYLARMLAGGGSLRAEDQFLLGESE